MKESILESIDAKLKVANDPKIIENMEKTVEILTKAFMDGNKLLIAGNGGSAADAQHFAAEIVVRYKNDRKGYPAIALTTDPSIMTATANDYEFNKVFARQVEALGKPGDVFVGISTSGNSQNIIEGMIQAKEKGMTTIAMLGNEGGKMQDMNNIDVGIVVPSSITSHIQESHITMIHTMCGEIENAFMKKKNDKDDLEKILPEFKNKKVLIIGDIILDKYLWTEVERISPEAPVPVAKIHHETFVLGGAANVANNVASLGGKAYLVGSIGKDGYGEIIKKIAKEKNIDIHGVIETMNKPTTVKTRVMASNQQLLRIDQEETECIQESEEAQTIQNINSLLKNVDAIIFSDYAKGFISEGLARSVIYSAKQYPVTLIADPKPATIYKFQNIDIITPNKKEAEAITGLDFEKNYANIEKIAKVLQEKINTKDVIITLGPDGMMLTEHHEIIKMKTTAKEVYDVSGAGDTVVAAIALSKTSGATMKQAGLCANLAAGVVVGKLGTETCSFEELSQEIKKYE